MPWLKMLEGETPGKTFLLNKEVTVVGRDAACEIFLSDHGVSKRHAKITRKNDDFYIEDLLSTNGTKVANQDLIETRRLDDGNLIEIGDTQFVFSASGSTILGVLDVSSTSERQIVMVRPKEKLHAVLEMARDLGGTIDLDGVLGKVLETLFRILPQADRGFILLKGERTDDLILRASKSRQQDAVSPTFSRTIFNHVTSEGQAILCEDIGTDDRFGDSPSVKESQIRTMICVPLWGRQQHSVGLIQIDTQDEHGRFEEDDLELMGAIAGQISVAIENARLHEIAVKQAKMEREAHDAREVQLAMIPDKKPQLPGYEFWDFYRPALLVGGDYFDYRPIPESDPPVEELADRWAIAIGDVSGKGMPAALLVAQLSSEVRLLLQIDANPAQVVGRLNRNLCAGRTADRFITFLLVLLDAQQHELTVVNAGHMGPMIRRSDGRIEVIGEEQSGPPLGIMEDQVYEATTTSVSRNDVVLLYTDGLNEALGPADKLFGIERLKQALATAPSEVGEVGESILNAIREHVADCSQSDDITLLCFKRI